MDSALGAEDEPGGFETTNTHNAPPSSNRLPRSYSEPEWEMKKDVIKYLYLDQDMPLEDVVEALFREYDFHTNVRMCKTRLKRWAFTKNSSKNRKSNFRHDQRPGRSQTVLDRTTKRLERRKAVERQDGISGSIELETGGLAEQQREADSSYEHNTSVNTHSTASLPFSSHVPQLQETPLPYQDSRDEEIALLQTDAMLVDKLHPSQVPEAAADHTNNAPSNSVHSYEDACPYRFGEKKFRLIQDLGSGAKYQGDSLGYGSYITLSEERPCSESCVCRRSHFPSAFTFLATISQEDVNINIFSEPLRNELLAALPEEDMPALEETVINGLVLLKHFYRLKNHLETIYSASGSQSTTTSLSLEMDLLVYGFLNDGAIFSSLGYEELYSQGFLSYQLWMDFQEKKFVASIDRLDEAFHEIDEESEAVYKSDSHQPVFDETHSENFPTEHHVSPGIKPKWEIPCAYYRDIYHFAPSAAGEASLWFQELFENFILVMESKRTESRAFVEAARNSDLEMVRFLLDRGANVNDTDAEGRTPLCIAAGHGYLSVVQLLIERGADVNHRPFGSALGPIDAAARGGHGIIVKELIVHGAIVAGSSYASRLPLAVGSAGRLVVAHQLLEACKEMATTSEALIVRLVVAIMSRNFEAVQDLLDYGVALDQINELYPTGDCPLDEEIVSLLVDAAAAGQDQMVKMLSSHTKVDLCGRSPKGTALSAALTNGHDSLVRFLLPLAGGQVRAAIGYFRDSGQHRNVAKLLRIVAQIGNERRGRRGGLQSAAVSANIRHLRDRFLKHHSRMVSDGSSSLTKFRDASLQLFYHRDAWNKSIASMRKLCRGECISDVVDAISFLCLAKAMTETLEELHNERYLVDFFADLQRWQILFASPDKAADLEGYRDAMWSMWNVEIGEATGSDFDETVLLRFQELASTLASKADLICGSSFWKSSKTMKEVPVGQDETATDLTENASEHDCGGGQPSPTRDENALLQEPKPPDPPWEAPSSSLADAIKDDLTVVDPLVTFIIAGAIFAIIIIFFQVLRKLSKISVFLGVVLPSIKTMSERYSLLESELVKGRGLVQVEGVCGSDYCVF